MFDVFVMLLAFALGNAINQCNFKQSFAVFVVEIIKVFLHAP